jgi:glycosyltransferase involved in cell wall biosynthesis
VRVPSVTVVVIGYNDADRLPVAVRSALAQTLHDIEVVVVDDGSTDATPEVLAGLAAADPRVRPVRLADNSGGCSRPRNDGLAVATGDYVTFLDSDDVLPRHACERLLSTALRTGADLTCGRLVRRHHQPRRHLGSHDELYLRPAVLDGILDRPRQLFDTPACGKLYRRRLLVEQGLSFPEGLLYEDLLFTTTAYCTASRIAIVPALVYVWNVRRGVGDPSITNRRELRNWHDRFEIHRRTDEFLLDRGVPQAVRAAKDAKFFAVDFPLFLRELRQFAPATRRALVELAGGYLDGPASDGRRLVVPPEVPAAVRAAADAARVRDLDRTLAAADWAVTGGVATGLGDPAAWSEPFAQLPFLAAVTEAVVRGTALSISGVVHDPFGRLDGAASAQLVVTGRVGGRLWSAPAGLGPRGDGRREFTGTLDLAALGRRLAVPTVGPELRVALWLRDGTAVSRRPLTARDARLPSEPLALPNPWRWIVGDRGRLAEVNGRLVIQLSGLPRSVDGAIDLVSRARLAGRRALARCAIIGG